MNMKKLYTALALFMTAFCAIEAQTPQETVEVLSTNTAIQPGEGEYLMGIKCFMDPNLKRSQSFPYFVAAVEKGHIPAHLMLGNCYLLGIGVAKDENVGMQWIKKGATLGDPEAQWALGLYYSLGVGLTQNDKKSFLWFKRAGESGHINSQYNVGRCYESGEGVAQDDKEALAWYKKAADQGYQYAQYKVGNHYEEGRGVDQDLNEACIWYKKAADQGHRPSQMKLEELGLAPQG